MAFDATILIQELAKLKAVVDNGSFADALVGAMNTGNGLMQQRIFTRGQDVEGQSFGGYIGKRKGLSLPSQQKILLAAKTKVQKARAKKSIETLTPYQRKRVLHGRQIAYKDLEYDGNLRRSIQVFIENDKKVVLAFNTDKEALIAAGQEQQITNIRNGLRGTTKGTGATKIFALNEDEIIRTKEQGIELVLQLLK